MNNQKNKITPEIKDYILHKFVNMFFSLSFLCIAEEHEGKKKIYISRIREILDNIFIDEEERKQIKGLFMEKKQ